ncbi:hypothetical protein ACFLYH_00305 [Candidatus Dependentiae bacterium]
MFNISFSRKNIITWGIACLTFIFLVKGITLSLFAAGLLLFSSFFYFISKKINNNVVLIGIMASLFSLMSWFFHGSYLTVCILALFIALLISWSAAHLLIQDGIVALWSVVISLIECSFSPPNLYIYITLGWFIGVALLFFLKYEKLKTNTRYFYEYINNSISWLDLLTMFILLCSMLLLLISKGGCFWALDSHHPFYELSIGQSFKNALFHVPDLSYSGKFLRFHFLSTQLPFYFSHMFNISLLHSLYIVVMIFLVFLSFLLILSFFHYHQKLKAPLLFVFFMPSFLFLFECPYKSTVRAPVSYLLAFIFIICALHFLICKKHWLLFICSCFLLLIKASYFMALCGGIFIFLIRQRYSFMVVFKKMLPYVLFFFMANFLFLSGAHNHNLWVLMPSFMFHYTKGAYFFCRAEAFLGILIFSYAFYQLRKSENINIHALASIILSGLIGWFLIIELTEGNSYQFIRAIYFPLTLFAWFIINKPFRKTLFICMSILSFYFCSYFLFQSCSLIGNLINSKNSSITQSFIKTYSWLGNNITKDSVVLFGLHYNYDSDPRITKRSAISGRQMYCEGFTVKGILMESDYVLRKANTARFYKEFVNLSALSKEKFNSFEKNACGNKPGIPLSQSPAFSVRLLHYLSLGKEWHTINRKKQIGFELKSHLTKTFSEDDANKFLVQAKITHIILEDGDTPSDFLRKIGREIYNLEGFSVFEVKHKVDEEWIKNEC